MYSIFIQSCQFDDLKKAISSYNYKKAIELIKKEKK